MSLIDCIKQLAQNIKKFIKEKLLNPAFLKDLILFRIFGLRWLFTKICEKSCKTCTGKFILAFIVVIVIGAWVDKIYQNWDNDTDRGIVRLSKDDSHFGDHFTKVFPGTDFDKKYMTWQNWDAADSMWYYTTTQGSDLIPYDFFIVLEQKNSKELFRSNKNMDKFRYIPQRKTFHNPDGLPLGLAKDTYKGKDYMGFTCAACHTNQINYNGVAIRVDGAQTLADMENFVIELSQSLNATLNDKEKKERFIDAVMDRNGFFKIFTGSRNYSSRKAVEEDLIIYASRVQDYTYINQSKYVDKDNKKKHLQYGYGRLDAFGRIFNRTRQHVLNTDSVNAGLDSMVKNGIITPAQANKLRVRTEGIITDKVFDNISMTAKEMVKKRELKPEQMRALIDTFFQSPNAPVSYPFVWDTPQHDFVQWNGLLDNAGPGPLGRNTGEVIGVFGTLDWREKKGKLTNPSYLIAKALGSTNGEWFVNFESSVDQTNLVRLEHHIADLWSPWWQDLADAGVFPKIDQASAARGDKLFDKHCVSCHHDINRSEKDRRVVAFMTNLEVSGTDRVMAENALQYAGYTGITRNQYMSTDVGNILMQEKMPVAAMLFIATSNVVATPDPDKWVFRRWADLVYNFISTMDDNPVGSSIKAGNYSPDTTASPFESLKAYKARPLNGIWATAPYLHNGSIPNLYELLLPPAERKKTFHIGSREFDPVNVGFVSEPGRGFEFDTTKPGNSNAGHDYKNKSLNKQDRMDLIEYMKTL